MDNYDTHSFLYTRRHAKSKPVSISVSPQIFILFILTATCLIVSGHITGDGVAITKSDYGALLAVKHDLIDFTGVLRTWNDTPYGACSGNWIGIKCLNGHVVAIQLPWKGLGGRISDKIGNLQALRRISLHDNVLGGPIPRSLGYLPNLRGVYLFNNRLSGYVPVSLGNSPLLQALDLSNNQLTGVIPPSVANSARLYRLNLSHNSLSGPVPVSLTRSPSLTFLSLQHNNLSGPVPDSWAGGNTSSSYQLQILTLDHNLFSGNIPVTLVKLGSLQHLTLSHNNISGVIPDDLGRLSRLQALHLSNNAINGTIPSSFSNLSSLVTLNLEANHLGGKIPDSIDRLRNLTELSLRNNKLTGGIPATIGNISGLSRLDLSGNGFKGDIPSTLSRLANLSYFNVSYNNLSGPVPSPLAQKFNSSSFVGNLQLCGYSRATLCPSPPPTSSHQPVNVPPPSEAPKKHHHRKLSTKDIIFIVVGALLGVLILLCCILLFCLFRKRAALKEKNGKAAGKVEKTLAAAGTEVQSGGEMGGKLVHFDGPFVFTADDLLCATAEIMGKSTYGTAYKATLEDGSQVVVKRLREKTTKGQREFESEAATLGKIRHPNLLALRAYYLGPKGEKLLVFDYMSRGSLASFLHARGPETTIDWATRMKITVGVARGLNHLHTKENIIHGNLTSSNVLLDEEVNAHIADYGLSRLMTAAASTNVVATAGTLGYRAPELSKLKNASTKTDVYSLGVIILELLTGKSPGEPTNGMDLPQWVASIVKEEWTNEVFDLELMRDQSTIGDELLNTLKLALHCVDPSPAARPEVKDILHQLEQIKPELTAATTTAAGGGDEGAQAPPAKDE